MKARKQTWQTIARAAPNPERAQQYFQHLQEAGAGLEQIAPELISLLGSVFSASPYLGDQLVKHPEWWPNLSVDYLKHARKVQGLEREVEEWLPARLNAGEFGAALTELRRFQQRELFRVGARDLGRLARTTETILELSNLADVCLSGTLRVVQQQLSQRLGRPYHRDGTGAWRETGFAVIGLGKLGGHELNYSSDVDVIFVYSEEGTVSASPPGKRATGDRGQSSHQYFKRLAEGFIAELTRSTPDGMLYRVDVRLRPEGDSGPLVRSLASYENYYAQWGQPWERMMLIKARTVAGDKPLGGEFIEMVHPFRFPRSFGEGLIREVAALKRRIENEVVRSGELERNVKLGRGGIREIEFIVQTLQLLHAGRNPFLQGAQTLPVLEKLVQYQMLSDEEAKQLAEAYCFLRDVEHRLQMEQNLQTHTLPSDPAARAWLARPMGFQRPAELEAALKLHTTRVRTVYDRLLHAEEAEQSALPKPSSAQDDEWRRVLEASGFRDLEKATRLAREFVEGPNYMHVSTRTMESARQLLPKFLERCPKQASPDAASTARLLSDPDRVLARLDSFVSAYGARATLFEMWNSNPSLFELLLQLFDRSEFLAEAAIRTPDLVDELVLSGRLVRRKNAAETLQDLRLGAKDKDQHLWIRNYHQAELMRIGLRDILGLADFEQNLVELSALADACLQYGLEVVQRRHKTAKPPFAIVGLGKLGGRELSYGSDLDLIFVADNRAALPKLQRVAADLMELISARTPQGIVFATDARLRPDGEKGLLVNTLKAYEDYYRQRAQLWEIQAITRTRPVAGNAEVGEEYQKLAARLTNFRQPNLPINAYHPGWKADIVRMRHRIEKERTPPGKDHLAIKTGVGGSMDAEFLAQALCLEQGWQEPNTWAALQRAKTEIVLPAGQLEPLLDSFKKLRRVEAILRRWSYEGETTLPDDPAPLYRVAIRCGWPDADAFMAAVGQWRKTIRKVFRQAMGAAEEGSSTERRR